MFKDLLNFKKQRTPKEALGFFIVYGGGIMLVTKLLGMTTTL